jgi:outer membrane receptor protein involved in Fe transport
MKNWIYQFLCGVVLVFFTISGFAQQPKYNPKGGTHLSILGKVVDDHGEPVPFANVALYSASDSLVIKGTATDEKGLFELKTKPGNYYLQISFLSFETRIIPDVQVKKADVVLKSVELQPSSKALKEVTVTAEKSQMVLKLDKRVFNVGSDLNNTGQNAVEILENIPSVDVDVEGNVSLRNNQNVRILIDGKPSALVGVSSNDALKMLQGDMVERVEVITNPSARYDAEGEVGIINIILKKEKKKGINGVFEARAGYPNRIGGSFTLNMRKKKLNTFIGYGLNYRERPGRGETYHVFYQPDTTFSYRSERDHSRNGLFHTGRAGVSYDFNKYNSLSFSGDYTSGAGVNTARLIYKDFNEANELVRTNDRDEEEDNTYVGAGTRLNYTRTFKRPDIKWTIDAAYNYSESFEDATIIETSTDTDFITTEQRARTTEEEQNTLVQSDFEMPLGKKKSGKFEAGFKMNLRQIVNDFLVEDYLGGEFVAIPQLDNKMIYTENIYAAYLMFGNKTKKLSYQGGLRYEYSDVTTDLKKTGEVNPREYGNLFPSVNLSYEFKKNSFLQASYSRRISRPWHWWLFPFYNLSDNRNIASGNPNLDPVFTDAFELGYMKRWEKANVLVSPYYRYSTGTVERILLADSNGINYRFPVNLGFRNSFGLEVSGSVSPFKWWDINASFNLFQDMTKGSYQNQNYDVDATGWTTRLMNKWKFKKRYSLQLTSRYRAPQNTVQGKRLAMYSFDIAGAMDLLKGNATLTLSIRDLLNTRMRRSITNGPDFYDESDFQWMSRYGQLTFTYRLNQKKNRRNSGMGGDGGEGMGR